VSHDFPICAQEIGARRRQLLAGSPVDGLSDERRGAVPVVAVPGTEALDRVAFGRARAGPLGPCLGEVV